MTAWSDIQAHMRDKYTLEDDTSNMMSMVWSYDDGRTQKIVVRRFQAFEREMIEFKSPFARAGDVDTEQVLRDNAQLPLATVALSGAVYLAVYNMLIDHLHMDDFDLVVSRVAAVADALEKKYASRDDF